MQIGNQTQLPVFAVDTGSKLGGCKAFGCLFSPYKAGPLKPLVKFPLQEEEVLRRIDSRLGMLAVTTTRLSTFFLWSQSMGLTFPVTFLGSASILGMVLVIYAELTWLQARPDCTSGSRATRAAERDE